MNEERPEFAFYRNQWAVPRHHWLQRQEFRPCDALLPYVTCFWVVTTSADYIEEYDWILKPKACAELIFNLYTAKSKWAGKHELMLAGPNVHHRDRIFATGQQVLGVRFSTTGFSELFRMPASEVADQYLTADEPLGLWAERLHQDLLDLPKAIDRLRHIERLLADRIPASDAKLSATHAALEVIARRGGKASMEEMVCAAGYCERHLRRQFAESVGLSPKQVARLKRFWDALVYARDHEDVPLAEVARRYHYCDPAHLADDFRDLMGVSPRKAVDILHFRLAPMPPNASMK